MIQNTSEWLSWRRGGIGSSDVGAIMGLSKFRTELDVYEEKTSTSLPEEGGNYIQEKGKRVEPKIRALLELTTGKSFIPKLFQLEGFPFIRASLDGWNEDGEIAEFKMVGQAAFESGKVPADHMAQVQQQLLVSGAKLCHYVPALADKQGNVTAINPIQVLPDIPFQERILEVCCEFWKRVNDRRSPAPSGDDYLPLKCAGLSLKLDRWKHLCDKIELMELERAEIESDVKSLVTHKRMQANGILFIKQTRRGNISYDKIPQLQGVDLEPFRKPDSKEFVTMKLQKEKTE